MHTHATIEQERQMKTEGPGARSTALGERMNVAVSHAIRPALSHFIEAGSGGVLVDVDGNQFIDLGSGIAVTNVGNAAPAVVERVQRQVEKLTHTCFLLAPYESYVAVCEELNAATPGDFEKRTALFNSGAEAVENAVKFARSYTGRDAVVAFEHAFHGRTNLTMSLTAKYDPYKTGFGPFAPEVYRAPLSYPYRDGEIDGKVAAARTIAYLEKQVGGKNIAALVIEPIQGEGGFIVPADGFLAALQEWCTANGVVFVVDEIQAGFARTGKMFASEHFGITPDIVVTAKGLAGGLPLSAVTGRAEIMDAPQSGGIGGTYAGNPLACEAALGVFSSIRDQGLIERAQRIGELIRPKLDEAARTHDSIGEVRGLGAMQGIEFVDPRTGDPAPGFAAEVARRCHRAGVIVLVAGTYGNVVRLLPPLVISEDLLLEGIDVFISAISEVHAEALV
jgi:4-aminobutyrate aminotransferase/(S)-3-amino-2-methylpropionate transaminase